MNLLVWLRFSPPVPLQSGKVYPRTFHLHPPHRCRTRTTFFIAQTPHLAWHIQIISPRRTVQLLINKAPSNFAQGQASLSTVPSPTIPQAVWLCTKTTSLPLSMVHGRFHSPRTILFCSSPNHLRCSSLPCHPPNLLILPIFLRRHHYILTCLSPYRLRTVLFRVLGVPMFIHPVIRYQRLFLHLLPRQTPCRKLFTLLLLILIRILAQIWVHLC